MKKLILSSVLLLSLLVSPIRSYAGTGNTKGGDAYYLLDNDPAVGQPGRWSDITNTWHYESSSTSYFGDHRATSIPGSLASYYLYTGNISGAVANLDAYLYSPVATGVAKYEFLAENGQVAAVTYLDQNYARAGWNMLNRIDDWGRRDRTIFERHNSGGIVSDAIQLRLHYTKADKKFNSEFPADKQAIINRIVNSNKNYTNVKVSFDTTRNKGTEHYAVSVSNTNMKGDHQTRIKMTDTQGNVTIRSFDKGTMTESSIDKDTKTKKVISSVRIGQTEPEEKLLTVDDLFVKYTDGTVSYKGSTLDVNQLAESKIVIFPIDLVASYLENKDNWNVVGSENILGRDTWKIEGALKGLQAEKEASATFTVNIEKQTGMLLGMKTFSGTDVVNKIQVNSFEVQ